MSIERRLSEAESELADLRVNFTEYLSVVTHDMSKSLRTSSGFAEIILKHNDHVLSEASKKHLDLIHRDAVNAKRTLDQMRVYANLLMEPKDYEDNVSIEKIVTSVLEDLDELVVKSNANIKLGEMPSIACEKPNVETAFYSIIKNALIHIPKDQPPIINISAQSKTEEWCFRIKDNGIGVPEKHIESIFKPLRRGEKKDEAVGDGMGLAIAKRVVDRHNGRIWVDNCQVGGSIFSFTLSKNLCL